jgi:alpha-beta hydrolase superfamily lysophospholipase
MLNWIFRSSKRLLQLVFASLLGALLMLVVVLVIMINNGPDLEIWHTVELENEYRANSGIGTFQEYLELEGRLFEELDQTIYLKTSAEDHQAVNRYHSGSLSDPSRWPTNWNRTFVMSPDQPQMNVLLLHGMSDSPYSMRSLGQSLSVRGARVAGLRIPGHGQAPSGLVDMDWEDMAAAVKLTVRHLHELSPNLPIYLVGYSNGGALAVHYALDSLQNSNLPKINGLVLLSPEIGISKLAALAVWQERLGHLLGLEKLAWNSLLPEYDPWKYGSFALNAGKQAYEITLAIQRQITQQEKAGKLGKMPPILAFQSIVDATVLSPALVSHLFDRLHPFENQQIRQNGSQHELVLFDINRFTAIDSLLKSDPTAWAKPLMGRTDLAYDLYIVSNKDRADKQMISIDHRSGSSGPTDCETGLYWPESVYSLSHVALPFPPDDPVYGQQDSGQSPGIYLGSLALRGERNVLQITPADMLRLRSNPFYDFLEGRMLVFMGLENYTVGECMLAATQ